MGACARNMYSDSAEIKPAQCCIKLVFHLTYTMMRGSTKLKLRQTSAERPSTLRHTYIPRFVFGQKSSQWAVAQERTYVHTFTESKTVFRAASIRLET